ncbi:MAG: hypothetical protein R3202_07250, partial [Candidatus Competibacterales bacterium]|nr:hypothetical protein [Candidatus Competibacterales bacterium]
MKQKHSLLIATGLIGFAVAGFLAGRATGPGAPIPVTAAPATPSSTPEPLAEPTPIGTPPEPQTEVPRSTFDDAEAQPTVLSLLAIPSDFEQTAALYALLSEADAEEVRQHIRDAQLIGDRSDRQAAMGILFLRLAELDPRGVLAFLDESDIRERHAAIYSIFNGWAKYDLEGALDRLDDLPPGRDRQI